MSKQNPRALRRTFAFACAIIASTAIASSAASLTPELIVASARDARWAAAQVSATEIAVVDTVPKGYDSTK